MATHPPFNFGGSILERDSCSSPRRLRSNLPSRDDRGQGHPQHAYRGANARYRTPQKQICKISAGETVCRSGCDLAGWDFARGGQGVSTPVRSKGTFFAGCDFFTPFSPRGTASNPMARSRSFAVSPRLPSCEGARSSCCPVLAQYWLLKRGPAPKSARRACRPSPQGLPWAGPPTLSATSLSGPHGPGRAGCPRARILSSTTPPRTAEGEEDNAPRPGGVALEPRFIIARASTDSPATNPFTFNMSFRLAF